MARITNVKSAQQRYKTVPVLNEDGTQKTTPVMKSNGEQRVTKRGKPVVMKVTQRDTTQPLPNLRCDFPGCQVDGGEILPGTPYKHVTPKSGPYGGRQRNRHAAHPSWQPWDLSSSLSARIQQVQYEAETALGGVDDPDSATQVLADAAEAIRGLAEEKREAAQNMEEGFGHSTSQSEELEGQADELEAWADEVEGVDVPDLPDPEDVDCEECDGSGSVENPEFDEESEESEEEEEMECGECQGAGLVAGEDVSDDQMDDWRQEVEEAASALQESPL